MPRGKKKKTKKTDTGPQKGKANDGNDGNDASDVSDGEMDGFKLTNLIQKTRKILDVLLFIICCSLDIDGLKSIYPLVGYIETSILICIEIVLSEDEEIIIIDDANSERIKEIMPTIKEDIKNINTLIVQFREWLFDTEKTGKKIHEEIKIVKKDLNENKVVTAAINTQGGGAVTEKISSTFDEACDSNNPDIHCTLNYYNNRDKLIEGIIKIYEKIFNILDVIDIFECSNNEKEAKTTSFKFLIVMGAFLNGFLNMISSLLINIPQLQTLLKIFYPKILNNLERVNGKFNATFFDLMGIDLSLFQDSYSTQIRKLYAGFAEMETKSGELHLEGKIQARYVFITQGEDARLVLTKEMTDFWEKQYRKRFRDAKNDPTIQPIPCLPSTQDTPAASAAPASASAPAPAPAPAAAPAASAAPAPASAPAPAPAAAPAASPAPAPAPAAAPAPAPAVGGHRSIHDISLQDRLQAIRYSNINQFIDTRSLKGLFILHNYNKYNNYSS